MSTLQLQKSGSYMTTIPRDVVETLRAEKGDKLHFSIMENGEVKVIKVKSKEE